ncbi:MAG: FMN-binding protein [Colwelliaceae bacterium]|nr:FMN-binding protein [Colwelliaceae bacterium]
MKNKLLSVVILCCISLFVSAKGTYQTTEQFLKSVFQGEQAKAKSIWLKGDDKKIIESIMSHKYNRLRIRYWQLNDETVWVLDEIGKEKPITVAIHIHGKTIQQVKVLAFRESRGDEVRHSFFTDQFMNATLTEDHQLTEHIDGITGATMSVRALTKVARLALWLNNKVQP